MTDLNNLPLYLDVNATYQAVDFRQLVDVMFSEGVLTGFVASQRGAGANMSVDVTGGRAIVTGDTITSQGKFLAWEDSTLNVPVEAAPGSNSRIDLLVLKVYDATSVGSGSNKAALEIVKGTAAASPVAPAVPDSAILLATIGPILTSTTSITDAMITDARTFATLAYDVVDDAQATRLGTAALTVGEIIRRDANGRAKVATPSEANDIAHKSYVDDTVGTSAATASTLMRRDASSRAKVANPSAATDIANKQYVDNTAGTSAATASALMRRDGSGRVAVATPSASGDAATKGYVDTGDLTESTTATNVILRRHGTLVVAWGNFAGATIPSGWRPVSQVRTTCNVANDGSAGFLTISTAGVCAYTVHTGDNDGGVAYASASWATA